jgi:hypothetical protein
VNYSDIKDGGTYNRAEFAKCIEVDGYEQLSIGSARYANLSSQHGNFFDEWWVKSDFAAHVPAVNGPPPTPDMTVTLEDA